MTATQLDRPGDRADRARLADALRARLCRRIAAAIFLSVLAIELAILIPSYLAERRALETHLISAGAAALEGAYGRDSLADPAALTARTAALPTPGPVVGGTIDRAGTTLARFGEAPAHSRDALPATGRRLDDGRRLEVYYPPAAISAEVGILARLDSSAIGAQLTAYLWRIGGLILLISVVVCAATMLVVARKAMVPILSLRAALQAAHAAPQRADQQTFPWREGEWAEVGAALGRLLDRVARTYREDLAMMTTLAEGASDAIVAYDTNGRLRYANAAARTLAGCEDLTDMAARGLPRVRFDAEAPLRPLAEVITPGLPSQKVEVAGRDGRCVPCLIEVPRLDAPARGAIACYAHLTDISALQAAQDRLQEQNLALAAANRSKDEFLANVSHELRTPLNAILGFAEVLRDHAFNGPEQETYRLYAEDIRLSGAHLLALINDILDLSQIEAGRFPLRERIIDVAAAIEATSRLVRGREEAQKVTLAVELPESLPGLLADERAIKQILVHLLANAVQHTPAGGRVVTTARRRPDGAFEIAVHDTGEGMDAETVAAVFQPFKRGGESLQRDGSGAGLGLPLVKALTEVHNGAVVIDSRPGAGTCVRVCFPAERCQDVARESRRIDRAG